MAMQKITLQNCYEINLCGKEKVCPAANDMRGNGFYGGNAGGTSCMFSDKTCICVQKKHGSDENDDLTVHEKIILFCSKCDYYNYQKNILGYISYANFVKYKRNL